MSSILDKVIQSSTRLEKRLNGFEHALNGSKKTEEDSKKDSPVSIGETVYLEEEKT